MNKARKHFRGRGSLNDKNLADPKEHQFQKFVSGNSFRFVLTCAWKKEMEHAFS